MPGPLVPLLSQLLLETAHAALALFMKSRLEGREPTLEEVKAAGLGNMARIDEVEAGIKARTD